MMGKLVNLVHCGRNNKILFSISILLIWKAVPAGSEALIRTVEEPNALRGCQIKLILGLKELCQDYTLVYPQKTENSTFLLNLNNKVLDKKGTCINSTDMTLKQLCRIDEKFGTGYFFNKTTKQMVENPRARIYWETSFKGSSEEFSLAKQEGMCQKLEKLNGNARSVETFGSCIRLFSNFGCQGLSLAIYPGSNNAKDILNANLTHVNSIGPCLDDEFLYASFKDPLKRTIIKNSKFSHYNPDLVRFYGRDKSRTSKFTSSFVLRYLVGPKNRVEFLSMGVYKLGRIPINNFGTPISEDNEIYKSLEKEEGDKIAFAIPSNVGGPVDETVNIFPASPDCIAKWNRITSNITLIHTYGDISINFVYESGNSTRPMSFYYIIQNRSNGSWYFWYGRILNGNKVKINFDEKPQTILKLKDYPKKMRLSLPNLSQKYQNWANFSSKHNLNSSLANFNKPQNIVEQNCEAFESFEDIQESLKIANHSFVPKDFIEDMIGSEYFKAIMVYSGKNFTGHVSKYFALRGTPIGRCYAIRIENGAKSVETFGKCIRLYENHRCIGRVLEVYPGSENAHDVLKFGLNSVHYIGRCSSKDFLNASFRDSRKRLISKKRKSSRYY